MDVTTIREIERIVDRKLGGFRGKMCRVEINGEGYRKQIGWFHGWGQDVSMYESYESEGENFAKTVAIVEDEDGKVMTVDPEDIKFLDKARIEKDGEG